MEYLADTHTFLWFISDHPKLSAKANALIDDDQNQIRISIVSLWEIVIKSSLGKLPIQRPISELIRELEVNDIQVLPISENHLETLSSLPHHHRDPFDRMIVSQSLAEKLPLISADDELDCYGLQRVW